MRLRWSCAPTDASAHWRCGVLAQRGVPVDDGEGVQVEVLERRPRPARRRRPAAPPWCPTRARWVGVAAGRPVGVDPSCSSSTRALAPARQGDDGPADRGRVPGAPARHGARSGRARWTPAGTWMTRSSVDSARAHLGEGIVRGQGRPAPDRRHRASPGRSRSTVAERVHDDAGHGRLGTQGADRVAATIARRRVRAAPSGSVAAGRRPRAPRPCTARWSRSGPRAGRDRA